MFKFASGLFLGLSLASAAAQIYVKVPTNGVLKGYVVQNDGKEICRDPGVWNEFRGPTSYIVCP